MSEYIDNSGFFEQLEREREISLKRSRSYKGLIPSLDFDSGFYMQFLHFATPTELEDDIICKETIVKIAKFNSHEQ